MVGCREVMQGDYARISGRYRDIFVELDKECQRRIRALDKASFDLSKTALSGVVSGARLDSAGRAATYSQDIPGSSGTTVASRLRSRVAAMIAGIADYAEQERKLVARCESVSLPREVKGRSPAYLPCVVVERDALGGEGRERLALLPEGTSPNLASRAVKIEETVLHVESGASGDISFEKAVGCGQSLVSLAPGARTRFGADINAKSVKLRNAFVAGSIFAEEIALERCVVIGGVFATKKLSIQDVLVGTSTDRSQGGRRELSPAPFRFLLGAPLRHCRVPNLISLGLIPRSSAARSNSDILSQ